jgi:hypothetical protein
MPVFLFPEPILAVATRKRATVADNASGKILPG